jgi:hypothetical protein
VSRIDAANFDFEEWADRAYRRWQQNEEAKDADKTVAHNRLLVENGDPELDHVIGALEQGWREDQGRS